MNKEFVSYELAGELKELGFNMPCICGYDKEGRLRSKLAHSHDTGAKIDWDKHDEHLPAPLWQQVFDWLYDKHKIWAEQFINMHPDAKKIIYSYRVYQIKPDGKAYGSLMVDGFAWTPEELREDIISKALKKIKS